MKTLTRTPIHPLLVAAFPVVSLMATNASQLRPQVGIRSMLASLAVALVLLLILRALLRDWHRAALIASLAAILFFSYGHAYNGLTAVEVAGIRLGRHRYLLPLWAMMFAGGIWLILGDRLNPESLTAPLNLVSLSLLVVPALQLTAFEVGGSGIFNRRPTETQPAIASAQLPSIPDSPPDIYFIVLDAYARSDVLRERYGLDNSEFLDDLNELGFTVITCSTSNYAQTELSFAGTLNLNYLDALGINSDEAGVDRSALWPLIRRSQVRQILETVGYRTVAFETGFRWSELEDADIYYAAPSNAPFGLSAFEATLLRSTGFWALADVTNQVPGFLLKDFDRSAEEHFQRIGYVLDVLPGISRIEGPKFVFVHLVSPHSPFVFGPQGEFLDYSKFDSALSSEAFAVGYRNQIEYLNDRLISIFAELLSSEDRRPAIILQADHGPERGSASDRLKPLNAILLPEPASIREDLSLVNTFQVVLNALFDAGFPELPDISYYSTYEDPYNLQVVPDECGE